MPREKEGKNNPKDDVAAMIFDAHMQCTAGNLAEARKIYAKILKMIAKPSRQLSAKDRKAIKDSLNNLKKLLS